MAEKTLADLSAVTGVRPPVPVRVYLAANSEDFFRLQPGGRSAPFWAAGITYPALNTVILRQAGSSGQPIELEKTFVHELSHVVLEGAAREGVRIPHWFVEGLAQWQAREFDVERAFRLSKALLAGRLIPLSDLSRGFAGDRHDVSLAYDESFEFVNFLIGRSGPEPFHSLIRKLADGDAFTPALESAYGVPLETLEREWTSSLRMSYNWLPLLTSGGTVWGVATVLFLLGYLRKRREKARRMARWEAEERGQDLFLRRLDGGAPDDPSGGNGKGNGKGNGSPNRIFPGDVH